MGNGVAGLWNAPLSDYGIPGIGAPVGYVIAALVGVAIAGGLLYVVLRYTRKDRSND